MNKIRYSYLIGCTTFLFFIGYIVFSIISVSGLGAFYLRRGSVDCVFALDGVVFESSRWIASPLRVAVLSSVERNGAFRGMVDGCHNLRWEEQGQRLEQKGQKLQKTV
jgi:hypothetical protein